VSPRPNSKPARRSALARRAIETGFILTGNLTGNGNRSGIFAFVAFSDEKPESTPDRAGGMPFLKML
jgi:hypothetical protein